jgi:cysteinyl-tRNA synthetase
MSTELLTCNSARIYIGGQMTLNEFRLEMESYRRSIDGEARALKDPEIALEQLRTLYKKFDSAERQMADQVLAEWALSEDEKLRFDGLALIYDFDVYTAIPALRELAKRLTSSTAPSAPYELKKIERILAKLKA